jgi:bifunctional DNA-binding transcriptional regulator/antitoxin component of YhaV-PrlF toxin-antitoxin module
MNYDQIPNDAECWSVTVDEEGILTIPDDLLLRLEWKEGDVLDWQDNPDGTITLTKSPRQDYTDSELEEFDEI